MRRTWSRSASAAVGLLALALTIGTAAGSWPERGDDHQKVEISRSAADRGAAAPRGAAAARAPWPRWVGPVPTTTTTVAPPVTEPPAPPPTEAPATTAARRRRPAPPAPAPAPQPPAPAPTAPPAPPTTSPPPPAVVGTPAQQAMLAQVNAQRAAGRSCGGAWHGPVPALALSEPLTVAATAHAVDMATRDFFSHTGSDGSDGGTRISRAGYRWSAWGENIAAGQATGASAVDGWFGSAGHCANFMNPAFRHIGFGSATGPGRYGTYWVAALASPR